MAYNTIKVKKYSDVIEEITAAGTITPGMLVEIDNTGKVKAHSGEGKAVLPMFALEDELQGKAISDDYGAGDKVQVWIPYRGDQVYALLATGQEVTPGTWLVSDGNGYLQEYSEDSDTEYPQIIVGVALETVDTSDVNSRIVIRVI